MTDELEQTILNLYERGLLFVRVAGKFTDKSMGQEKVSVVVYEDKFYRITQRRFWWSDQLTCDAGWSYWEAEVVQVVYKTKVKKYTEKFWSVVE